MRRQPKAPDGPRHGHYPNWNHVPDQQSGTFRLVYQGHALPDPGAQAYTYSTFMFPIVDVYGAGQTLTRGVPAATEPAYDIAAQPAYILQVPSPNPQGTLTPMGLLPSDLVAQFTGKTV